MSKPWWASKTIWVGIAEVIGGLVEQVHAGEVAGWGLAIAIVGAVQVILRLVTGQPVILRR